MRSESINANVLRWIGCAAAALAITGCNLFLSPEKPRDNPFDPDNPTPGVMELKAFGYSANSVKLEWQTSSDGDGSFPNVTIIRNSVQEPISINDGTLVYNGPTTIADGDSYASFVDDTADSESDYYYAIWSYSDQDGTITYNGPLTDPASTKLVDVEISVSWDGYIRAWTGGPWELQQFDPILELQYDPGNVERYILLIFDFGTAPDFGLATNAQLKLYKDNPPPTIDWTVSAGKIIQSWIPGDPAIEIYNKIIFNSFQDFSDDANAGTTLVQSGTIDFFYWDVLDIVEAWLINEEPNLGILLRSRDVDGFDFFAFRSTEWGDDFYAPKLALQYYGDNPDIE